MPNNTTSAAKTLVFHEPSYPHIYTKEHLPELVMGDFEHVQAHELFHRLEQGCETLISFHGPYFPKQAWRALLRFLEQGGNLVVFGGMPFTRPVREDGTIEPEQQAYTDQLYLGPVFPITLPTADVQLVAADAAAFLKQQTFHLSTEQTGAFWSCYPKLTQVSDHPQQIGSAGPLDTTLTPLLFALGQTAFGVQRLATPAFLLDHRSGRFMGGRWLISAWQPASVEDWLANASAIKQCIQLAQEGLIELTVRPLLACYQPGERPSLLISGSTRRDVQLQCTVYTPDNDVSITVDTTLQASPITQERRIPLPQQSTAGLYRVVMDYHSLNGPLLRQESGFWLWDEGLVQATIGKRLSAGKDYFYQGQHIFPVFGTTYMDSQVQRKFLYLPNPTRWDKDFTEMKAAGINLIRTGIWTAWREFMPVVGSVNEAMLRALDAFVMTACKHNIQLIFTFFAFSPPLFEGENPWLDPRSLAAQQRLITTLTSRYSAVQLLSWDLINEPSFGNPSKSFTARPLPNYDRFELAAFRNWLVQRYKLDELQLRWRQTPEELSTWEAVTLPAERDYSTSPRDTEKHAMLKVMDYTHFSQEIFVQWASMMYKAIRATGNQMLIGVGQDESGTRLAPQFYAETVDYTTTHPWWNTDDLLWDMVLDKTLEKPNLIQEIGVMLVRDVDGQPWRSEQACADLLERKLVTGLIARGAGLVQWLWHTNAAMTSDNENSIGLVRTDGSIKPELLAMLAFGSLMQTLKDALLEQSDAPQVWLIVPYGQWFLRPELVIEPTRQAIRVLGYDLHTIPQMMGEQQLVALVGAGLQDQRYQPRYLLVPAIQMLSDATWQALLACAEQGATVLITGVLERDEHNLYIQRSVIEQGYTSPSATPVSRYETLELADTQWPLTFGHDKIAFVKKQQSGLISMKHGQGKILWCGLPVELGENASALKHLYAQVLQVTMEHADRPSPLLLVRRPIKEGTLFLLVSESANVQTVQIDKTHTIQIAPNRAGAVIQWHDGRLMLFGQGLKATHNTPILSPQQNDQ